jgi:hypothetical protein
LKIRRIFLAVSSLLLGAAIFFCPLMADDRIALPPLREEFYSPSQAYLLVISTADHWQSQRGLASCYQLHGGASRLLWQRTLPHQYRPRFVVVSDGGGAVLLDEWINIKTPYAVMIMDRRGGVVAQYDFDAVARLVGVAGADIVVQARYGAWLTGVPRLGPTGDSVLAEVGGRHLAIQLRTGQITIAR